MYMYMYENIYYKKCIENYLRNFLSIFRIYNTINCTVYIVEKYTIHV